MKLYSTNDGAGLVWTDPEIFKRFAIGPLIAHAKTPEELKEAYAGYAGMSADDLVNHRDTAGSYDVEDLSEEDLNKRLDEPETYNNLSLRDLYEFNDDTDPFGKDLYDFLDSTMPKREDPSMLKAYAQDIYDTLSEADSADLNRLAKLYSVKDIQDRMADSDPDVNWDDASTIDAFVDGLKEDAKGRWSELDESEEETDVNDDGDTDVVTKDVDNDGTADVVTKDVDNDGTADEATVIADDEREAEDATSKAASEMDVEPSIKDTMINVAKKAAKQQMKDEADKEIIDKDISDDLSDLLSSKMDSTGNLKLSGNILNALRDIRF